MSTFHKARLRLTAWYLLIIMMISILFSIAFYNASTQEIQRFVQRMQQGQLAGQNGGFDHPMPPIPPDAPTIQQLQDSAERIKMLLVLINGLIFIVAGGAGYFLAGRTLKPIKIMLDEQDQFISNSSHELRTPIATLRAEMEASLLEKHISDTDARKLIKSNLEEVATLQSLSNNLLNLAKLHNVSQEKYRKNVSMSEIIKMAEKKVSSLAKHKQITISSKISDITVLGEANSLCEMFVILLDNAIKYSSENSKIIIKSEFTNNMVRIAVTDHGIGISEEDLIYIFDRFYRSDKSRSQTEGFGLGLSIAKRIAQTHNGSITVKSKLNQGTTFIVQLPVK